jgi:hypothetical protein
VGSNEAAAAGSRSARGAAAQRVQGKQNNNNNKSTKKNKRFCFIARELWTLLVTNQSSVMLIFLHWSCSLQSANEAQRKEGRNERKGERKRGRNEERKD